MEKVSVATRCPCMKTPNDPESTICADAGAGLPSFLSAIATAVDIARIQSAPVTSNLLLGVSLLTPAQDCMPPPPRLCPHLCRWFRYGQPPSCTTAAAFRKAPAIAPDPGAADEGSVFPRIAATIPPRARPGKPNGPPLFQSEWHSPVVRKLLRPMPPRETKT